MHPSWTQPFEVRSADTDGDGAASLPALCDYLQEAAGQHATANGISIEDLRRDNLSWVLGRLELEVDSLPRAADRIQVTTWPSRVRSFFVVRDFLIQEEGGDRVLSRATSTWFVIDRVRRRAVRVPERVRAVPHPDRPRALDGDWAKLPQVERVDYERHFRIGPDDLDSNDHVNNVHYVKWALETVEDGLRPEWTPQRLTIDFLSELTTQSEVVTTAQAIAESDGSKTVIVRVAADGGAEAARMRCRWIPV